MTFETVRDQIKTILENAAAGRYTTVAGLAQTKGARENISAPRVTIYFQRGTFPESSASFTSPIVHEASYQIEVTCYVQHELTSGELAILQDPSATPAQRAAALAQLQDPDLIYKADQKIDATLGIVYQVLMDANNYDLGLPVGTVADRWIRDIQKDPPASEGEYIAITGALTLTVRLDEPIVGEAGTPATVYESEIEIKDDQGGNLGTSGILGGT